MREDGLDPAQCVAWFFSEAKPEDATRLPVVSMALPAAFNAGQEAGERFEYRPGIVRG